MAVQSVADADLSGALSDIGETLKPAPARNLAAYAARLMLDTKRRAENSLDEDARLDRMVEVLSEFPADVAEHVCLNWFRRPGLEGVFTPAPAELYQACLDLTTPRRMLLYRIEEMKTVAG